MPGPDKVIEFIGEGKTDLGEFKGPANVNPESPTIGIIPILVHKLCSRPPSLKVIRRRSAFLQRGTLRKKAVFAKVQAFNNGSDGAVFVVDAEGEHPVPKSAELIAGRDERYPDFPMAVGVAHPCIETWLLVDERAIARAMKLAAVPVVPPDPEALPAPCKDRRHNPKTVLAECAGKKGSFSSQDATAIASAIDDLDRVQNVCAIGFKPFAEEVIRLLVPLFVPAPQDSSPPAAE